MSTPAAANTKRIIDSLSHANLLKRRRIVTSKKLVIIRPNVLGDNYTYFFSYQAAEQVKNKAIAEGWTVTDLQANSANRANVEQTINSVKPDFIIHYDHGSTFTLFGQTNNVITPAIDSANIDLLTARAVSTVSCESAEGLGPLAINFAEAKAYLGYDELHWVSLWYLDKFTEAANAANYALLEGKTFQQAYDLAIQKHTEKYNELTDLDLTAAGLMLHNRDHLTILGNTQAKASGLVVSEIKINTILPELKNNSILPELKITTPKAGIRKTA